MISIHPNDEHNQLLVKNTHPENWKNPKPVALYNLVVIGGGTAGLVSAAGAASLGAKVALIEKSFLGGDCLNAGCVPSKCLIASSRSMYTAQHVDGFAENPLSELDPDFAHVMKRMRRLRAKVSFHDSVDRFSALGMDIFLGNGHFTGTQTIEIDGAVLKFKKAVIATGTRPFELPIPGLLETGFLTNKTIFSLTEKPKRLAIIGAGPIGCEMAQAFRRFGTDVVLFQNKDHILPREDADAAKIVQEQFVREGIELVLNCSIASVESSTGKKVIHHECGGTKRQVEVDEILVAAGRTPNVEDLNLEAAAVEFDTRKGVHVNDHLQTANSNIYGAGDVCMKYRFTHAADAAARIVIQNALFFGRKKLSSVHIPWATYTDPEIAHIGIYEHEAKEQNIEIDTYMRPFHEVDRAICDGEEEGFVKVHVRKGTDHILGASIVARHAGDMIGEFSMAMTNKIGLGKIASVIHPYPTQAEAIKHVGDLYNRTRLTPLRKRLLQKWFAWGR